MSDPETSAECAEPIKLLFAGGCERVTATRRPWNRDRCVSANRRVDKIGLDAEDKISELIIIAELNAAEKAAGVGGNRIWNYPPPANASEKTRCSGIARG